MAAGAALAQALHVQSMVEANGELLLRKNHRARATVIRQGTGRPIAERHPL
jgi:hypothetical protein